jgi:hypothetical protein
MEREIRGFLREDDICLSLETMAEGNSKIQGPVNGNFWCT